MYLLFCRYYQFEDVIWINMRPVEVTDIAITYHICVTTLTDLMEMIRWLCQCFDFFGHFDPFRHGLRYFQTARRLRRFRELLIPTIRRFFVDLHVDFMWCYCRLLCCCFGRCWLHAQKWLMAYPLRWAMPVVCTKQDAFEPTISEPTLWCVCLCNDGSMTEPNAWNVNVLYRNIESFLFCRCFPY